MKPDIVYEDGNIIICNKPVGMASQSERSFDIDLLGTVRTYRSEQGYNGDVHIINRLDKPVGGLVLFALNKKTAAALSAMSGGHSIEKQYYAVVSGVPKEHGGYTDWLVKDSRSNMSVVTAEGTAGAKKAVLSYEMIESCEIDGADYSLVRIRLYTGRHHQIRVQFAAHGYAIHGDIKYNADFTGRRGVTPALFAYRLSFNNPAGAERITVEVKPSGGVWERFCRHSF